MERADCTKIGTVSRIHGVRGELAVNFLETTFHSFKNPKAFFIEIRGELVPFFVEKMTPRNDSVVLKLEEVDSVEDARSYLNKDLFLPLLEFSKLSTPSVSGKELSDLSGFFVIDRNAGELGMITEIMELPLQSVASLIWRGKEILFPLNKETVLRKDLKKKIIYTDLPAGLIDIYM